MEKLRIAIVGCGGIANGKHMPSLKRVETCEMVAFCDLEIEKAQKDLDEKKAEMATAVGQQYTDLAMPNPKGKTIRVSDYVKKNKYTLIDFWASWCGPCRAEMPTVVKAYNLYHKKGFEVVGVSFDNNKAAWVKAIAQLKLSWPHMSDL